MMAMRKKWCLGQAYSSMPMLYSYEICSDSFEIKLIYNLITHTNDKCFHFWLISFREFIDALVGELRAHIQLILKAKN